MTELLDRPRLAIIPRAHFLLTRTFDISDSEDGTLLGTVAGGSTQLELRDAADELIATFDRPWVFFRVSITVTRGNGVFVGTVRQLTPWGKVRAEMLDDQGAPAGALEPVGIGATRFQLLDGGGQQVGELSRRMRFWFRTGDYEMTFDDAAVPGLRLLALAGVVAIDKSITRRRAGGSGGAGGGGA